MTSGAVLAAGAGSRMGTPKGELVVDGVRLVDRALAALRAAGCAQVIAVVRNGVEADGSVVNEAPERGLRSSLQLAVDAATEDALVVVLADMPGVDAATIRAVLDVWRPGRIAVAAYGTRYGHPTVMSVTMWREALTLAGPDEGARRFLALRQELVDSVISGGNPADLDSPADLSDWQRRG